MMEQTIIADALDNLRVHQRQLDMDGIEVGVSRQALNEAITYIGRLMADRDFWKERLQVETRARIEAEALSRTGAVKVDRQRLNMEISKWATDSDLYITIDDVEALHLSILSTLEPAAPEGQQPVTEAMVGAAEEVFFKTDDHGEPSYDMRAALTAAMEVRHD